MANAGQLAFVITAKDLASKEFQRVNGEIAKMEKQTKGASTGLGGLLGSISPLKIGLFGAVAGVTAFTGVLFDAVSMAIDEQKNIAKLTAALKANVPGWDGNTDAIEKLISSRERLAFSDDDLRDSLAVLVAATHDVTKAEAIQATAMDLARLKGISLQAATEALTKIEGGSFRILKSLGIVLKDGATQTEALAAVTAVAAGQAAAYADTITGKLEVAQIRLNDRMEDLGAKLLPAVANGLDAVNFALDVMGGTLDTSTVEATRRAEEGMLHLQEALAAFSPAAAITAAAIRQHLADTAAAAKVATQATINRMTAVDAKFNDTAEAATEMELDISGAMVDIADATDKMKRDVIDDLKKVITDGYDLIQDSARLTAVNVEIAELRKATATKKMTAEQRAALIALEQEQAQLVTSLAEKGAAGYKNVADAEVSIRNRLKTAVGQEREVLLAELALWKKIEAQIKEASAAWDLAKSKFGGKIANLPASARAGGGPVWAGQSYTVGEEGTETLVMGSSGGYVIPHSGSSGSGGGGDVYVTSNTYLDGALIASRVDKQQYYKQRTSPR